MIESLELLDTSLFVFLNSLHNEWLDVLMYLTSEKLFWIPVYIVLLFLVQRKVGWKHFWFFVGAVALTITLCDRISVELFKEVFLRYRPCHNLDLKPIVHLVDGCGGRYGFVSSHAANHFGISLLTTLVLRHRKLGIALMLWAALIAYSRVYLGVHYPADIFAGGILGCLIGWFTYRVWQWAVARWSPTGAGQGS